MATTPTLTVALPDVCGKIDRADLINNFFVLDQLNKCVTCILDATIPVKYRQVFTNVIGVSDFTLTVNGGVFPTDLTTVDVFLNGQKMYSHSADVRWSVTGSVMSFADWVTGSAVAYPIGNALNPGILEIVFEIQEPLSNQASCFTETLTLVDNGCGCT